MSKRRKHGEEKALAAMPMSQVRFARYENMEAIYTGNVAQHVSLGENNHAYTVDRNEDTMHIGDLDFGGASVVPALKPICTIPDDARYEHGVGVYPSTDGVLVTYVRSVGTDADTIYVYDGKTYVNSKESPRMLAYTYNPRRDAWLHYTWHNYVSQYAELYFNPSAVTCESKIYDVEHNQGQADATINVVSNWAPVTYSFNLERRCIWRMHVLYGSCMSTVETPHIHINGLAILPDTMDTMIYSSPDKYVSVLNMAPSGPIPGRRIMIGTDTMEDMPALWYLHQAPPIRGADHNTFAMILGAYKTGGYYLGVFDMRCKVAMYDHVHLKFDELNKYSWPGAMQLRCATRMGQPRIYWAYGNYIVAFE
jgi:hypothetical protein